MNNLIRVVGLYKSYYDGLTELPVLRGSRFGGQKGGDCSNCRCLRRRKKHACFIYLVDLDRPTEGTIFYEGEDIFALNDQDLDRFRNEEIGYVFQFHHLLPEFTALENVAMPGLIARQEF